MEETNEKLNKLIDERATQIVKKFMNSTGFSKRKLTDTPTDDLMLVNRKYVNLNGATTNRPVSSIVGQQYFDTTLGYPIWANGNNWVDSTSSVVG